MTFVLYGKPFRKINKPQLINTFNENNLSAEVTFDASNHYYKIVRGMKPNVFEIWEDGVRLNQDAANFDYQAHLENNILGMNYITFTQLIVLGKATHVPFMKLVPLKRREMIEHLLGISIFYDINSLVKDKIKNTKFDFHAGNSKLELLSEKLAMKIEYRDNTKGDRLKLINSIKQSIKKKEDEIDQLLDSNKSIVDFVAQISLDLSDDVSVEHKKYKVRRNEINHKVKSTNKDIIFFENNTTCPTCTQNIDDDYRNNFIADRNLDIIKLANGNELVDEKIGEFEKIEHINKLIQIKIDSNKLTIKQNNIMIRRLENDIITENERIDDEYNDIEVGHDVSTEIAKVEDDINSQIIRNEKLSTMVDYYDIMGIILDDNGAKSLIIKKYLPLFNRDVNEFLLKLGLNGKFILDEQFNETILSRGRNNFSYNSFSEGQKLRIDLALMLAFRNLCKIKNSVDSNLLLMDEIFDSSLNQSGVDAFVDILTEQKDINTYVITHTPDKLNDRFENTVEVTLLNGFSQIKEI